MNPLRHDFLVQMADLKNIHGRQRVVFLYVYSDGANKKLEAIANDLNMSFANIRNSMYEIYKFFRDVIKDNKNKKNQLHAYLERQSLSFVDSAIKTNTIYASPAQHTAAYFIEGKKHLKLLDYLTNTEWQEIFYLVVDALNNHDLIDFLTRMQDRINHLLSRDVILQEFLGWVEQQSILLSQKLEKEVSLTAVRACYFDFDIDLDINRSLSTSIDSEFTRDFICASLIARVEQSNVRSTFPILSEIEGLREEPGSDPAMAIALGRSKVVKVLIDKINDSHLKDSIRELYIEIIPLLAPIKGEARVERLTQDLELWGEQLRHLIVPYWSLGDRWRYVSTKKEDNIVIFSDEQKKKLEDYYYANKILVLCLKNSKVNEHMREKILSTLLCPVPDECKTNDDRLIDHRPLFHIPENLEDIQSISEKVAFLLNESKESFRSHKKLVSGINNKLPKVINMAFQAQDSQSLLEIHKILFQIYETSLSHPHSIICLHEHSPWLAEIREQIETEWLKSELDTLQEPNCIPPESNLEDSALICDWIKEQANYRTEIDDNLLKFFKYSATEEHFKIFVQSDAILNYRFCDALALAQIHFSEVVKAEIVHNMWDEVGHGVPSKLHSREFSKMLESLNLDRPDTSVWQEDWRPYYGHNMYFLFGLNRRNFFMALGSLTMPELFDSRRDQAIVDGLNRVFSHNINYDFYAHHIETDMRHGQNWLDKVISPIVRCQNEASKELAIGCSLRMKAMRYYNQYLAERFGLEAD